MPPVLPKELQTWIEKLINSSVLLIFSKTTCPFCSKVKKLFDDNEIRYISIDINEYAQCNEIQNILEKLTQQRTVPNVFVRGNHIGGCDDTIKAHSDGKLEQLLNNNLEYDYDIIVIGGGSGGLAASKEAGKLGAKVAVFDFVKPSPMGTTWGLGGTCVNVGCIPKKLMHQAALLKHSTEDAIPFGWNIPENLSHKWDDMITGIQNYIKSLNWGYRVALRNKDVSYFNCYAQFIDSHNIIALDKYGKENRYSAKHFIIATGERPRYPVEVPGAYEYGITSDDLFSLPYSPGKTLVVGASYVSLECAGFLASIGLDVTVMVRSIFLRGFDQQMANLIGNYMEEHGRVKFIKGCVPIKVTPMEEGSPGKKEVIGKFVKDDKEHKDWYNTVIFAIGRDPCTTELGLDKIGVELDKANRVKVDQEERTNVENIYAIGDIISNGLQLTPIAIQAGKYLVRRLLAGSTKLTDYTNVPTTVFTPLEYGSIGYSEEAAIEKFGVTNIEVFHQNFKPLEWTIAHRPDNACYAKLICNKPDNNRVIGLHVLGPNAGEITQGYAVALRLGATKSDFDDTIGIHPTCSESFTTMDITKSSGGDPAQSGC